MQQFLSLCFLGSVTEWMKKMWRRPREEGKPGVNMKGCREEGKSPPRTDILLRVFVLTVVKAELLRESQGNRERFRSPSLTKTVLYTHSVFVCAHTHLHSPLALVIYTPKVWAGLAVLFQTTQPWGLWQWTQCRSLCLLVCSTSTVVGLNAGIAEAYLHTVGQKEQPQHGICNM